MRRVAAVLILGLALAAMLATASAWGAEPQKFGIESLSAELSTNEAGAHPDLRTKLVLNTDPASSPDSAGVKEPYGALKDYDIELPPGLIANLNAVSTCSNSAFATGQIEGTGCPFSSQVGIARIELRNFGNTAVAPIFNLETVDPDHVARLGLYVAGIPTTVDIRLRSGAGEDYGVTAEGRGIPNIGFPVVSIDTTIWGVPADSSHDTERLTIAESGPERKTESPPRSFGRSPAPFMTNPTTCGGPLSVRYAVDSYEEPGAWREREASLGAITNCGFVAFDPSFSLTPTSQEAGAPSGADATLTIPQNEAVVGRATSALAGAVVLLPQGLTLNPSAAEGLGACSEQEAGADASPAVAARGPESSKIATVEIDSPSLTRPLQGAVYQRTPEKGHLTRAWLIADDLGVHIKLPGEFVLDPATGRITSLFLETPQLPLRQLQLHFKAGAHGVLAMPKACGTYQTEWDFTPWSGGQQAEGTSPMTVDQGCGGGGFSPSLLLGTTDPTAGAFSSVTTTLSADYNEQNLAGVSISLPPGLLAKLAGVPLCPDAAAASGDCPASSQVGTTTVATGPGPSPLWIPQPGKAPTAIYLAGPYKGGPYSLVVKTPAQAGPFDLGNVVVRAGLLVDPESTRVTAVSDPLPQILEGVPVSYRTVSIVLNRPEFTLNPTNCAQLQVRGTATSASGASASIGNSFRATDCATLGFKPKLSLSLKGKVKRTGNPALSATLTMPKHGANIAWTRVALPRGEQVDNRHINNPCTRVQFNAGACPPKSILGHARAFSPLLDKPLEGPVYFRSNGGERQLPDMVADLHGPIHVVLVGFIDSKGERLRTTFGAVPDAPVSKFTINLFGGKKGLIVNSHNLCKADRHAQVRFKAQNGRSLNFKPNVKVSCGKKRHH